MTALGGKATFRRQQQDVSALFLISLRCSDSSRENVDLHPLNMLHGITVMRGGTLKLVKMQPLNAPISMLSMPSWRRMGVRREFENAQSLILLSEEGMLIFVIEWPHQ